MVRNRLFHGDNLDVLRHQISDQSVDLIYADPPFNSNRDYPTFTDIWRWTPDGDERCDELIATAPAPLAQTVQAFRTLLGPGAAMAYLVNLLPRLRELHRVLKPTGSLYLHCDPTMSHYAKVLLDAVFAGDRGGFLNEIVWSYRTGGTSKRWFGRKHDTLLLYVKDTAAHTFNAGKEKSYLSHKYGFKNVEIMQEPAPIRAITRWSACAMCGPSTPSAATSRRRWVTPPRSHWHCWSASSPPRATRAISCSTRSVGAAQR